MAPSLDLAEALIFDDEAADCGVVFDDVSTACPLAFGPYRVLGLIGKGGMGLVYHAIHEVSRLEVAVKTVRVRKRGMLHRIRREIRAFARIDHPGLVRIIEIGQSEGLPWYAMELLRGQSLQDQMISSRAEPSPGVSGVPGGSTGWDTQADFVLAIDPRSPAVPPVSLSRATTATLGGDGEPETSEVETIARDRPFSPDLTTTDGVELDPSELLTITFPPVAPGSKATPIPIPVPVAAGLDGDSRAVSSCGGGASPFLPEGPHREFLVTLARLCETLAYLHGEGIVHRDVKPQNVIIRPDGTPVLLDLGLASYFGAEGRESLEVGGKIEGTPEYMSPEQIRGEYVDARADLYAVGCILYEGLTGQVPFQAGTPSGTLRAHLKVLPTPPSEVEPSLPPEVDDLILRLLAKKAVDRLGFARDIVAALGRLGCVTPGWEVDRPSRDYLYRPGFVGRSASLSELEGHVRRVLARPGHCVFLRGRSGAGKTRFIMEAARQFEQGGLTVATGECLPIGVGGSEGDDGPALRATALHPFRSFLQMVADCCLERGNDEVARLLGPGGAVLAACEPALGNLPGLIDGELVTEPGGGEGLLPSRMIEALGNTLAEFGRTSPLVVLLDDLQWADPLTLHFLALFHVGVWDTPNVAIVASFRAEEEAQAIRGYRPVFEDASYVEVGPLEEPSLCRIVREMLGSNQVEDRFVAHLARRSGGNPFFVAEYLRASVTEGLLRRDDKGCWRADADEASSDPKGPPDDLDRVFPLPASLHDLVVRRLSGLSADARRFLELAATFGREVDAELLETAGAISEDRTLAALEALLVAEVLEEGEEGRFRFAHDKLREVAYEQIPPTRRRELHRAVALAIETRLVVLEDRTRLAPSLGHHWYRSIGDRLAELEAVERAIGWLGESTRQAVDAGLSTQAVEYGRAAARLLGIELPEGPKPVSQALAVELDLIRRLQGDRLPAELIDLPTGADPWAARSIELLLQIQPPAFFSNQIGLFALMASKNLSMTLDRGLGPLAPSVFAMYALVRRIILDDPGGAQAFARLAVDLDARTGGTQTADVLFLRGWFVAHWLEPLREILPGLDRGARLGMASGQSLYACYNHAAFVALTAMAGEPLDQVVREADERLKRIGDRVVIARFHCILERQLARALAGRTFGPTLLTDELYDESRDLSFICRTTNANQVGSYHVARLKLCYYQREYRQAIRSADQARTVFESFARQPAEVDLVFFHALALLATADEEPANLVMARAQLEVIQRWRETSEPNFAHKALLVSAELARVEGLDNDGRRFHEAARMAEQAGYCQDAALALELGARHLARIGDHAPPMRRAAIDGYRAWGAHALADRLEAEEHYQTECG